MVSHSSYLLQCDVKYEREVVTSTVTLFDGCTESAIYCCPREVPVECPRGTIPNPCFNPGLLDYSECNCKGGPVDNVFYPYFTPDYPLDYGFGGMGMMVMSMGPDYFDFTCSEQPFATGGCGPPTASSCVPDPCGRRGYYGGEVKGAYSGPNYFYGALFCGERPEELPCMDMMGMSYCDGMSRRRGRMLKSDGTPTKAPPLPASYKTNPALTNVDIEKATFSTLSDALKCDAIASGNRPIHTASKFRSLRQMYEDVVGSERSSITQLFKDQNDFEDEPVPAGETDHLRIEEIFGRGRGIVASRDIKKGETLWSDVHLGELINGV